MKKSLVTLPFQGVKINSGCFFFILISTVCTWTISPIFSQTVAGTYNSADIPTSLGAYSSTCNGPLTKLSISLPAGGPWTVTAVDVSYNMTAQSGGYKSHQRSYIRCQNTAISEDSVYMGTGNEGVQSYMRTGVSIANGSYSGSTVLNFEMRAWRTTTSSGCSSSYNRVDNFTWIVTVHYGQIPDEGSVGIGTASPAASAILDLSSTTQAFLPPRMTTAQRDAIASPVPGMMIFNLTTHKLEIYCPGWSPLSPSSPSVKKLLGGESGEFVYSMQQTTDGGYIMAGSSQSSNTGTLLGLTNHGGKDYWIVRLDNTGNIMWQKLLGGSGEEEANSIQETSDGGFIIAGWTTSSNTGNLIGLFNYGGSDGWVLKLDSSGSIVWQKLLGGYSTDIPSSIHQTNDGGYIMGGLCASSNTGTLTGIFGNGVIDDWVLKMDGSGNTVWQKLYGGYDIDGAYDIQPTHDGGYIVAGYTLSSNSGTLAGLFSNGIVDSWILKLNSSGNISWQKLLGGSAYDYSYKITETNNGGFIAAGYSSSSNTGTMAGVYNFGILDYWILNLDDSGNTVWQKLLGGDSEDRAQDIQLTSDGGCIVTGYTYSSNTGTLLGLNSNGGKDYWIFKMDNSGVILWQKLLGGTDEDTGTCVRQTNDGGFIIGGYTYSNNSGTLLGLINNGGTDFWSLKLDASGNPY